MPSATTRTKPMVRRFSTRVSCPSLSEVGSGKATWNRVVTAARVVSVAVWAVSFRTRAPQIRQWVRPTRAQRSRR